MLMHQRAFSFSSSLDTESVARPTGRRALWRGSQARRTACARRL